jgi:glycosyltransferase involved in cell wall biosynthesis
MSKTFIVIAAFNEAGVVGDVVKGLHKHGWKNVVVVDDGSQDATADEAEDAGAVVLQHPINRGQGAALKTGIDYALMRGADVIVTFDADDQHDPADVAALVRTVEEGADIALGSRFLGSSNAPLMRKLMLKAGALMFLLLYGVRLTDSHNGFRALSRKAAQTIQIRTDKMEHASEIIGEIAKHKLNYKEVPVHIRYTERSMKQTKQGALPSIRIAWKTLLHWVNK